jgi:hypothetical protein
MHTLTKHKYCCFGQILDKVIQVEGRKQLGKNFGTGGNPDCRGLTLKEIQAIDWNKVDFGEFIEDLKVKFAGSYKTPSADELKNTVEGSLQGIEGFDSDLSNAGTIDSESFDASKLSNLGGVNMSRKDHTSAAEEDLRLEEERKKQAVLARLNQERLEQERIEKANQRAKEKIYAKEQKRQARQAEINVKRQAKQAEIDIAKDKFDQVYRAYQKHYKTKVKNNLVIRSDSPWALEKERLWKIQSKANRELSSLKNDLRGLDG